jgi:transcriptional regulator with XRE-family HTH domain
MSPLYVRVKEAREARGMTQSALAELAGVRRATVHAIESGATTGIDFAVLEALADALDVDPAWLIARTKS